MPTERFSLAPVCAENLYIIFNARAVGAAGSSSGRDRRTGKTGASTFSLKTGLARKLERAFDAMAFADARWSGECRGHEAGHEERLSAFLA